MDSSKVRTIDAWKKLTASDFPIEAKQGKQKEWDNLVAKKIAKELLDNASGSLDQARLRAAAAPHSEDWLLAPPITAVGLRMTNETIMIATGMRLGINICDPHLCPCGKQAESRGSTVYHVATVLRGSVGTTWSTTSFGEQCRGPKFQQQRNTRSTTKWQQASRRRHAHTVEAR